MSDAVHRHYELYPYPSYPLLASVRRPDTYALNLDALWARFNGRLPRSDERRILIAGCGSFAPYPFAVANPDARITALDLSRHSLNRARLHCLLHGKTNVTFQAGDLCDPAVAPGQSALIDAFGVLHHLDDPAAGLAALARRLMPEGILRMMVYSRYARLEEESIRRALKLLKISDPAAVRRMIKRSQPGSRLAAFAEASSEARFEAGLADSLLHPRVTTYRVDGLLDLVRGSGLQPLLFAHQGALPGVDDELVRLRTMERERQAPGNFVLYLGKPKDQPSIPLPGETLVMLNPCLRRHVSPLALSPRPPIPRLGRELPTSSRAERSFLRRFVQPQPAAGLTPAELAKADIYIRELFLLQYRA